MNQSTHSHALLDLHQELRVGLLLVDPAANGSQHSTRHDPIA